MGGNTFGQPRSLGSPAVVKVGSCVIIVVFLSLLDLMNYTVILESICLPILQSEVEF